MSKYASIVEAVGLVIALASISVQWTQENRIARAEHGQAVAEQAAEFHYKIIDSEALTELWYSFGRKADLTHVQRMQYRALLEQYLIFHENAFFQHEAGLLDERIYRSLDIDLRTAIKKHDLTVLERPLDQAYAPEFARHLNALAKEPATADENRE